MDQQENRTRIVVLGPTASGKTSLAATLAQKLGTFVISADSRQCYQQLDIGTAKPSPQLLEEIPHRYISILPPDQPNSAADFRRMCDVWENEADLQKPIIYAGGSTLYLKAVLFNLDDVPPANTENIKKLEKRAETEGLQSLLDELKRVDPEYAGKMDGLNRHRILRGLDVWMQTGKPFSSYHTNQNENQPRPGFHVFGIDWPRETLHKRIGERVDEMLDSGLIEETKDVLKQYPPDIQALQTVGYREVISWLDGKISREKMIADIKTSTRRYARRQLTWFRKWPFIEWLDPLEMSETAMCERILKTIEKGGS